MHCDRSAEVQHQFHTSRCFRITATTAQSGCRTAASLQFEALLLISSVPRLSDKNTGLTYSY